MRLSPRCRGVMHGVVMVSFGVSLMWIYPSVMSVSIAQKARPVAYQGHMPTDIVNMFDDKSRSMQVLQVGACDGFFDIVPNRNDLLHHWLALVIPGSIQIRAVLVEPNPPVFKKLQENANKVFKATDQLSLLNYAVCPEASGLVSFYVVSKTILTDMPSTPH